MKEVIHGKRKGKQRKGWNSLHNQMALASKLKRHTQSYARSSVKKASKPKAVNNMKTSTKDEASTSCLAQFSRVEKDGDNKIRQQKPLTKSKKTSVIQQVKSLRNAMLSVLAMKGVCSQLPLQAKTLPVSSTDFFTEHLKERFATLYEGCATITDRYLKFQLKWHGKYIACIFQT